MNKPTVSIVVPVYMVEPYIHQCIDSILAQTFTDFELILVDDGSTDSCPEICDDYAQRDLRVLVIHKGNGGQSTARNAGMNIAQGKYLYFVDSDDYIAPNLLQTALSALEKAHCDVCSFNYFRIESDVLVDSNISLPQGTYTNDDLMKLIISDTLGSQVWRYIYKKELWDDVRFPEGRRYEDIAATYLAMKHAQSMVHICDKLYFYRILSTSTSFTKQDINQIHIYYGFKERYEFSKQFYPQFNDVALALVIQHALNLYNSSINGLNQHMDAALVQEVYSLILSEYSHIIASNRISVFNKCKVTLLKISRILYKYIYRVVK